MEWSHHLTECQTQLYSISPDVHHDRKSLPTEILNLLGRSVDGARQLGVRLSSLGSDHNVSPVPGSFLGHLQSDATTGPTDVQGLARQLPRVQHDCLSLVVGV